MIANLPLFHRVGAQPVIVLGGGEAAEAKRRLVERAGGLVIDDLQEGIDKGARLAFIAHEDDQTAKADAIRARCAGLLVNVTDRPELCDFTVPSVLDRAPVLIAVGTGGASAGLAKQLRLRLESLLPQSLGTLADALYATRDALRTRWPDVAERRRAIDAALTEGGPLDPLDGRSIDRLPGWLAGEPEPLSPVPIEIVLRSADPDDLTLREMRWLGAADVIAYEAAVPDAVLDRSRADAVRIAIAPGETVTVQSGLTVTIRR